MPETMLNTEHYQAIYIITLIPLLGGILLLLVTDKARLVKGLFALIISGVVLYFAITLFLSLKQSFQFNLLENDFVRQYPVNFNSGNLAGYFACNLDSLSRLILLFVAAFSVLILIYSLAYGSRMRKLPQFYAYILLTLGASEMALLADNLLLLIIFWGFLGITLYKLVSPHDEISSAAAKKTLIIVGASDGIMILGIGILWKITGKTNISEINLLTDNALAITAFLCLAIGAFTKAGAFPFHSWIPDYTQSAPAPASAYLPASLDKLLGIYFLVRICNNLFILNDAMRLIILIIGVTTIIIAVMMALVQHNYKKLLGYHAVSQVGYMVTGIGLGTVLGIVGGLFHMVNHALYKSGLFLSAGSVHKATGKDDLDDLGGLSRQMPITFFSTLIFALSISGIPPLNGFASKWLIYQGIIDFGKGTGIANQLWIVWLALAVIGSALTLASFIKFVSGIFLGRQTQASKKIKEVSWMMWLPQIILALVCIGFGIFASGWVIPGLFSSIAGNIEYTGLWNSSAISMLILISIVTGILIYLFFSLGRFRTDDSFIGGETMKEEIAYKPTGFYETIRNFALFRPFYKAAENKKFDIYDSSKNVVLRISHLLSSAHNGILSNLAFWVLAGLIIMFIFLLI